ncbi:MAG: glycoside hydrolase family 28 protein [Draconibacterium sp.]|nr:glycoside hydrolase family 28 protein [Draconibacterium sp.]
MKNIVPFILIILFLSSCNQKKLEINESIVDVESILQNISAPEFADRIFRVDIQNNNNDSLFDYKTLINNKITECSESGGGKVILPSGNLFCKGSIILKSNVNLHLEEGTVLTFSQDPKYYLPVVLVRWEGTEAYNYSPFIYAKNQKNIAISGKGTIDGNGSAEDSFRKWRSMQKKDQEKLREMGRNGIPVENRIFGEGHFLRPQLVHLLNCENVLFEDFKLIDGAFWLMQPTYCNNVIFRGVRVESTFINNDGIDIDSDTNVLVEDCFFNTGDDFIAIKSGRDQDAWRVNKPSKNIVIRNCKSEICLHGISFGSEMSGGIDNVFVENLTFGKIRQMGIQFKSNKDRGGYIKNILIKNIQIDSVGDAISFTNQYHSYEGGNSPSEFKNITIENINCKVASNRAISIIGLPEMPITNVVLKDISIKNTSEPSEIINVKNMEWENVNLN